jgi:hypothetical protein
MDINEFSRMIAQQRTAAQRKQNAGANQANAQAAQRAREAQADAIRRQQRDLEEARLEREMHSEAERCEEERKEFLRSIIIGQAIASPRGNYHRKFR